MIWNQLLFYRVGGVTRRVLYIARNIVRAALSFVDFALGFHLLIAVSLPAASLIVPLAFSANPLTCSRSIAVPFG